METPKPAQQLVRQYLMIGRMIWGALVLASAVYAYVAYTLSASKEIPPDQSPGDLMFQTLVLLSFIMAIGSVVAKNWILSRQGVEEPNHVKMMTEEQKQVVAGASPEVRGFILSYSQWLVAHIVALALAESVIIFGLVWAMVSGRFGEFVPFWVGGVLLMIWHFPRPGNPSRKPRERRRH